VIADAKTAFGRRAPGQRAVLVADTLEDGTDGPASYTVTFAYANEHVRAIVDHPTDTLRVAGAPPGAEAAIETADGRSIPGPGAGEGCFQFTPLPRGVLRLCFGVADHGWSICTDWIHI
jgi:hypothetical protein